MAEDTKTLDLRTLSAHLGYALRRAQLAVFGHVIDLLSEFDLRPAHYSVLLVIEENPGRKQTEIASALGIQRPNFVAMLDGLQKRGFVVRRRSPDDRRSHCLLLTPQGAEVLKCAKAAVKRHEEHLRASIGPDDHDLLLKLLWRATRACSSPTVGATDSPPV